jgi:translation initiation factor IF-3
VAVPRRFDRRPPERDQTRVNERIRVPEVRVIDDEGNQIGVMKTPDALSFAQERDLDLVEVAPEARPPVCRVLDYSKYKYEQAQKLKQARKHQQQITVREIKFRPKIAQHDYDTKKHHVERFLRHKDKVKVTIMFRGREVTHPERGTAILDRLAEELSELGVVEQRPMQEGRNMTMMMAPSKAVLAGRAELGATPDGVEAVEQPAVGGAESGGVEDGSSTNGDAKVETPVGDGAEAVEQPAVGGAESGGVEDGSSTNGDAKVETPAGDGAEAVEQPAVGDAESGGVEDGSSTNGDAKAETPVGDGAEPVEQPAAAVENGGAGASTDSGADAAA